eukprot:17933-Chlamydomonas_euryale.AAC.9
MDAWGIEHGMKRPWGCVDGQQNFWILGNTHVGILAGGLDLLARGSLFPCAPMYRSSVQRLSQTPCNLQQELQNIRQSVVPLPPPPMREPQ